MMLWRESAVCAEKHAMRQLAHRASDCPAHQLNNNAYLESGVSAHIARHADGLT